MDRAAADEALSVAAPPDAEGRRTVVLPVESAEVAYDQLLPLGSEVEVLAPAALRERFADTAERLRDLYR